MLSEAGVLFSWFKDSSDILDMEGTNSLPISAPTDVARSCGESSMFGRCFTSILTLVLAGLLIASVTVIIFPPLGDLTGDFSISEVPKLFLFEREKLGESDSLLGSP